MSRFLALFVFLAAWASTVPAIAAEPASRYERRWVYIPTSLVVQSNVGHVISLIERAGQAGYNGVVLADNSFNVLEKTYRDYRQNVELIRNAARRANVEIIPKIFSIGWSEGWLVHDPNLAEGIPVVNAPFVVKDGEAVIVPDSSPRILNSGFEQRRGDRFARFTSQEYPGTATFADRSVTHGGSVSCRIQPADEKGKAQTVRLVQRVNVRPRACYRYSCWVRTDRMTGEFNLLAIGAGDDRTLTFNSGRVKRDQDWTRFDVTFNSLDQTKVNLYVGVWNGTGTIWVDDLKLEELPLVNVLRRDGCPLVVTSADGRTTFEEGRDFEPVRDDKYSFRPFNFQHEGARIRLTENSRIKNKDRLRVSWYHALAMSGHEMIMCCLTEPKVYALLRDQARQVNQLFEPKTFLMDYDEIRLVNWCQACRARKLTPGALLADSVKQCTAILKEVNPACQVATWSDMFDPNHNATARYCLANGSLEGSWEGLPKDVIIVNWNGGKKSRDSLQFFAGLGNPQIISGYADSTDPASFQNWETAARGVSRVSGFMYTTWKNQYNLLEDYGKSIQAAK